ncbi:hypothetical protein N657DRAFT_708895 [Parathielavia appendiculata]|uniref:Uncharacterized protein n=1 Tax=Parathielavia appendiculata TaxID=2587402 RepID=A0AAN6U424_9PEZI|nr:hypothetical protein N657DRAFT_708895 [Parathielavia appendiculata]
MQCQESLRRIERNRPSPLGILSSSCCVLHLRLSPCACFWCRRCRPTPESATPTKLWCFSNPYITGRLICLRARSKTPPSDICTLSVTIENYLPQLHNVGLSVYGLLGTAAAKQGFRSRAPFGEPERFQAIRAWLATQWSKAGDASRHSPLPTRLIMVGNTFRCRSASRGNGFSSDRLEGPRIHCPQLPVGNYQLAHDNR